DIEHALASGEAQRADRPRAPAAVDPRAEHAVEAVVAGRDRVEHRADLSGRLRQIGVAPFGACTPRRHEDPKDARRSSWALAIRRRREATPVGEADRES